MVANAYDVDDGELLDPVKVGLGIRREVEAMRELNVGTATPKSVPKGKQMTIWSGRWCHRKKEVDGETVVRSRWVIRQFKSNSSDMDVFSGCPGQEAVRILLAVAAHEGLAIIPGDFSVAFMHTPMDYEGYVEAPTESGVASDECWLLLKALNGLRKASQLFQKFLIDILTNHLGFASYRGLPTLLRSETTSVKLSVHVDDPLTVGQHAEIISFHKSLEQWLEVRCT